jgi:cytochrome c biogenesis protein CcmG/thiol:disulfide interchange protein DsbE
MLIFVSRFIISSHNTIFRKIMKTWFQTLFVCMALFAFGAANASAQKGGDKLPSVSVKDLNGKTVNIKQSVKEGQITVISFWATWCSPCKKELDNVADLYPTWQKKYNVHLIAVSVDDARTSGKVKSTVDSKGWDYTVLLDSNEELKRALNISSVPFTLLINQKGEIVYTHSGYKAGDEKHLEEKIKELSAKK